MSWDWCSGFRGLPAAIVVVAVLAGCGSSEPNYAGRLARVIALYQPAALNGFVSGYASAFGQKGDTFSGLAVRCTRTAVRGGGAQAYNCHMYYTDTDSLTGNVTDMVESISASCGAQWTNAGPSGTLGHVSVNGCKWRDIGDNPGNPPPLRMGDSAALTDGVQNIKVTVERVIDPLPYSSRSSNNNGNRFVGIVVTINVPGSTCVAGLRKCPAEVGYDGSPGNSSTLFTTNGQQTIPTTNYAGGVCNIHFAQQPFINIGGSQTGCIAFQIPSTAKPSNFKFSEPGGDTAGWKLS